MKIPRRLLQLLGALLLAAATGLEGLAQSNANPPERMTYQGFLVDANGVALGNSAPRNYDVVFRIWNAQTGGARQWSEGAGPAWAPLYRRWPLWLLLPLGAAFAEEALWEVFVNQELDLSPFDPVSALTPLLAVPQLTHYLLDGWIWKMPPGSPLRRWLELPC
jgi:hypothetical protein